MDGDAAAVRELLGPAMADIDVQANNDAALVAACQGGHDSVVQELLKCYDGGEADPQVRFRAAFVAACAHGHIGVVKRLLAVQGQTSLNGAAIRLGFEAACYNGHVAVFRHLVGLSGERLLPLGSWGGEPLRLVASAAANRLPMMRSLLALTGEQDPHVDTHGYLALTAACERGHMDALQLLLSLPPPAQLDPRAHREQSLQAACLNHQEEAMQLLLSLPASRRPTGDFLQLDVVPPSSKLFLLQSAAASASVKRRVLCHALADMYGNKACAVLHKCVSDMLPQSMDESSAHQAVQCSTALVQAVSHAVAKENLTLTVAELEAAQCVNQAARSSKASRVLNAAVLAWFVRAAAVRQCGSVALRHALQQATRAPPPQARHGEATSTGWFGAARVQPIDVALPALGRALLQLEWWGFEDRFESVNGLRVSRHGRRAPVLYRARMNTALCSKRSAW